jgi:hypothetical protein
MCCKLCRVKKLGNFLPEIWKAMEVEGGELCNVVALEAVVLYVILQPYVFGTLNRGAGCPTETRRLGSYESFATVRTRRQASEGSSRFLTLLTFNSRG